MKKGHRPTAVNSLPSALAYAVPNPTLESADGQRVLTGFGRMRTRIYCCRSDYST